MFNRRNAIKSSLALLGFAKPSLAELTETQVLAERIYSVLSEYLLLLADIHRWQNASVTRVLVGNKLEGENFTEDYHIFLEISTKHRIIMTQTIDVGPNKVRAVEIRDYIAKTHNLKGY